MAFARKKCPYVRRIDYWNYKRKSQGGTRGLLTALPLNPWLFGRLSNPSFPKNPLEPKKKLAGSFVLNLLRYFSTTFLLISWLFTRPVCQWIFVSSKTPKKKSINLAVERGDGESLQPKLGGGNSNIFYVHPENWGRLISNLTSIFFKGVETTNQ